MFWSINKFSLIAIPYFIVAGNLMMKGVSPGPSSISAMPYSSGVDGGLAIAVMFAAIIFRPYQG